MTDYYNPENERDSMILAAVSVISIPVFTLLTWVVLTFVK